MLIENQICRLQARVEELELQVKTYLGRVVHIEKSNQELRELVTQLLSQPVKNDPIDWTLMTKSQ